MVQEEVNVYDEFSEMKETVTRTDFVDIGSVCMEKGEQELVVACGGSGGEGSGIQGFRKGHRLSPIGGERKRLKLTLKIVADVALVGVPKGGYSTFLAAVTRSKQKIANLLSVYDSDT